MRFIRSIYFRPRLYWAAAICVACLAALFVIKPILRHRIILIPEREMEGTTANEIIDQLTRSIEIPR